MWDIFGLFYKHGLTLIFAWIGNYMPSKVWDEITYPFPNYTAANRWSFGMDKKLHLTFYNGCNYLSILGLKLNHVSKRPPWGLMWSWKYHHLFPASASKRHQIPMKMQWCHIEYITGYATMHFTGVWWMQPSSTYKQCLILLISTDWSIKASILYSDILIYISFFTSH